MPIRKMACSLAVVAGLFGGGTAFGQAMPPAQNYPDFPSNTPSSPSMGEYKLLRGQSIQLTKPANSSSVNSAAVMVPQSRPTSVAVTPQSPPVMPIPTYSQPVRYMPTVAVPEQVVPPAPLGKELDPKKDDAKPGDPATLDSDPNSYKVKTKLPEIEELYRLDAEKALEARIKQEYNKQNDKTYEFPTQQTLATTTFQGRAYPKSQIMAESNAVCHEKLLFEDKNAERYGWDLGFVQPLVSFGYFTKDVLFLPYHLGSRPHCQECTPRCLPGDQVPYMIYHEGLTITGVLAETGIALALAMVFP